MFRGAQNLSASLDVIVRTYPAPSRILLAGNSAGGFGTHAALPLVRKLYPDVPIELVNDSGMGIQDEGSQETLNEYWNSSAFFPASCETCIGDDGNLTDYHKWQLAEDENLRMGFLSTKQDAVVLEDHIHHDAEIFIQKADGLFGVAFGDGVLVGRALDDLLVAHQRHVPVLDPRLPEGLPALRRLGHPVHVDDARGGIDAVVDEMVELARKAGRAAREDAGASAQDSRVTEEIRQG